MALKWVDSLEIAIELDETYPDVDPKSVNFVDLQIGRASCRERV